MRKTFSETIGFLHSVIDYHGCRFNDTDKAFLSQFGIKTLTALRDSCDDSPEVRDTLFDVLQRSVGHNGCNNGSDVDFLCEKDGVVFMIYIHCGYMFIADDILVGNCLMSPGDSGHPFDNDEVGYDPMDYHKFDGYGSGYVVVASKE